MHIVRLLLVLAVVDSIHLVSSFLSFSLPRLSLQFCRTTYHHIVPLTLPLAQVSGEGGLGKISKRVLKGDHRCGFIDITLTFILYRLAW